MDADKVAQLVNQIEKFKEQGKVSQQGRMASGGKGQARVDVDGKSVSAQIVSGGDRPGNIGLLKGDDGKWYGFGDSNKQPTSTTLRHFRRRAIEDVSNRLAILCYQVDDDNQVNVYLAAHKPTPQKIYSFPLYPQAGRMTMFSLRFDTGGLSVSGSRFFVGFERSDHPVPIGLNGYHYGNTWSFPTYVEINGVETVETEVEVTERINPPSGDRSAPIEAPPYTRYISNETPRLRCFGFNWWASLQVPLYPMLWAATSEATGDANAYITYFNNGGSPYTIPVYCYDQFFNVYVAPDATYGVKAKTTGTPIAYSLNRGTLTAHTPGYLKTYARRGMGSSGRWEGYLESDSETVLRTPVYPGKLLTVASDPGQPLPRPRFLWQVLVREDLRAAICAWVGGDGDSNHHRLVDDTGDYRLIYDTSLTDLIGGSPSSPAYWQTVEQYLSCANWIDNKIYCAHGSRNRFDWQKPGYDSRFRIAQNFNFVVFILTQQDDSNYSLSAELQSVKTLAVPEEYTAQSQRFYGYDSRLVQLSYPLKVVI